MIFVGVGVGGGSVVPGSGEGGEEAQVETLGSIAQLVLHGCEVPRVLFDYDGV